MAQALLEDQEGERQEVILSLLQFLLRAVAAEVVVLLAHLLARLEALEVALV